MGKTIQTRLLRILLPAALIAVWFIVGGVGGPIFGKLEEVSSNDQTNFLPSSAESTEVQKILEKFQKSRTLPAIVVFESKDDIVPARFDAFIPLIQSLGRVEGVSQSQAVGRAVIGPIVSDDKRAAQLVVQVADIDHVDEVVERIKEAVRTNTPDGYASFTAGPAGLAADLSVAFSGIDGILLLVALIAVFVILLAVYRSLLLPVLVLLNSVFALCGAILLVYFMAKWGWITLSGQSQGILSILVIGAATDYSLLLVARYRESLERIESRWTALMQALKVSVEPIVASGATVMLALICLLFSDLNSNRSLGPIAASGIVFSLLGTLTFLPSLLYVCGRNTFWPFRPRYHATSAEQERQTNADIKPLWRSMGRFIAGHARVVWIVTTLALLAGSVGLVQLDADGVSQNDIILSQTDSVEGQKIIDKHFASSDATPVAIIAPEGSWQKVLNAAVATEGVVRATVFADRPIQLAVLPPAPKVVDGRVLINATLQSSDPSSRDAQDTIVALRENVQKVDKEAIVGGRTASLLDINTTAQRDLVVIIPIVLSVILVVLILLLRSIVAPVVLIGTVVLSFAATIGISALVFNNIFGFSGADPSVPLFGFVFLVALGVDYNIFLMSRVREEALQFGTHRGIVRGLGKTGGVITSAGIVLAATFAALGVIPILFLAQIAFIVAFGVLLDTIVVRSLLVPALSYDLHKVLWWPSRNIGV